MNAVRISRRPSAGAEGLPARIFFLRVLRADYKPTEGRAEFVSVAS